MNESHCRSIKRKTEAQKVMILCSFATSRSARSEPLSRLSKLVFLTIYSSLLISESRQYIHTTEI